MQIVDGKRRTSNKCSQRFVFSQMVWASSHKVGCGLSKCARGGPRNKPFFNYVCNYCPMWVTVISIRTQIENLARLMRIYCVHEAKLLSAKFSVHRSRPFRLSSIAFAWHLNVFFCSGNRIEQLGTPYKKGKGCSSCIQSCHSKKIRFVMASAFRNNLTMDSVHYRLCQNSCNAADLWANCHELFKTYPDWLCRQNTTEGLQRQHNCLATCNCQGKIHD